MLPRRLYRIYIRVLMQIHATYDILPHTSNARSLSPPRWVDRRYILYTHTRTPLFTRSSLVYFRNLGEKDMRYLGDVGRRGGVGREATLDPVLVSPEMDTPRWEEKYATFLTVFVQDPPLYGLLRSCAIRKREREREEEERKREKKILRRPLVAPHSRGSNWFAIRVPRIANSLEFLPVQWS